MCRTMVLTLGLAALAGCAGRSLGHKAARNVIMDVVPDGLESGDVEVDTVSQTGSRDAVVEAKVRAAFRLENEQGRWLIREIRVGRHQWERLDLILQALESAKTQETRRILEEVASGLEAYARKNGGIPAFKDFVALSDALYPGFLPKVIRLDAWERPFAAARVSGNTVRLSSSGPDGKAGSSDDIEITRAYY